MRAAGVCVLLLIGAAQAAAEEPTVSVSRDDDLYSVQMQARLSMTPALVHQTFTHYENLPRINPAIEQVQLRAGGAPATRLYTQVRVCVAFFCKHIHQVQDIRTSIENGAYALDALVLPAESDLKRGAAHWRITPCGVGSCLSFNAQLEPDFWVPPLLGPWLIERKLEQEARITVSGIERVAHEDAR